MRITSVKTFTVGNPWKNRVFVRLEIDEGVYGGNRIRLFERGWELRRSADD